MSLPINPSPAAAPPDVDNLVGLPVELWNAILDEVLDKPTLAALSLTSRGGCKFARPYLFRTVVVDCDISDRGEGDRVSSFVKFCEASSHIGELIRDLHLLGSRNLNQGAGELDLDQLPRVLEILPTLKVLSITGCVRCSRTNPPSIPFEQPAYTLDSLFIDVLQLARPWVCPLTLMHHMLSLFKEIGTLHLIGIYPVAKCDCTAVLADEEVSAHHSQYPLAYLHRAAEAHPIRYPVIRALQADMSYGIFPLAFLLETYPTSLSLAPRGTLKSVVIGWNWQRRESASQWGRFFSRCGGSVQNLTLDGAQFDMLEEDLANLGFSSCVSLESLRITLRDSFIPGVHPPVHDRVAEFMVEVLSHVHPATLKVLTVWVDILFAGVNLPATGGAIEHWSRLRDSLQR